MTEGLFLKAAVHHHRNQFPGHVIRFLHPGTTLCTLVLLLILAAVLYFLTTGSYTRKQVLSGYVDNRDVARISAQVDGRVINQYVREGDIVAAGTLLAVIGWETIEGAKSRRRVLDELEKQYLQIAQDKRFLRQRQELDTRKSQTRLIGLRQRIARQQSMAALQARMMDHREQRHRAAAALREAGHLSEQDWIQLQTEQLAEQQQALRIDQDTNLLTGQVDELLEQIEDLPLRYRQEMSSLELRLSDLRQSRIRLIDQDHRRLAAPIAGEVTIVNIKPGMEVKRGDLLLSVIPSGRAKTATLYVPSHAFQFLRKQQKVQLRLPNIAGDGSAMVPGGITHVSDHPVLTPGAPGGRQMAGYVTPLFQARVRLGDDHIEVDGERVQLKTGMELTCTVRLETLSLIEWLIHPLRVMKQSA